MKQAVRFEDILNKYGGDHTEVFRGTLPATAANYSTFWNIINGIEVTKVSVSFTTASTSGTLQIEKLEGTTAPGSGTNILTSAFSLSGTANTVMTKTTRDMNSSRVFYPGDRMAFVDGGTLTNLTDLVVTIYYKPLGRGDYR